MNEYKNLRPNFSASFIGSDEKISKKKRFVLLLVSTVDSNGQFMKKKEEFSRSRQLLNRLRGNLELSPQAHFEELPPMWKSAKYFFFQLIFLHYNCIINPTSTHGVNWLLKFKKN